MNWTWLLVRSAIGLGVLGLLFFSQRFWYRAIWRVTSNWGSQNLRVAVRLIYVTALLLIIAATADSFRMGRRGFLIPTGNMVTVFAGLWFFSALFAYLAVKFVRGIDRIWAWLRAALLLKASLKASTATASPEAAAPHDEPPAAAELLPNP